MTNKVLTAKKVMDMFNDHLNKNVAKQQYKRAEVISSNRERRKLKIVKDINVSQYQLVQIDSQSISSRKNNKVRGDLAETVKGEQFRSQDNINLSDPVVIF